MPHALHQKGAVSSVLQASWWDKLQTLGRDGELVGGRREGKRRCVCGGGGGEGLTPSPPAGLKELGCEATV